ncbi:hypothetical protein [Streptomyces sp. NPDC007905]|uniref:hypothetical protein n=1 Tax=Streptomyces sp. NPDC007905 TaxID=3364788 RepID=UPI0036EBAC16
MTMLRRKRAAREREIAAWWRKLQAIHNGIGVADVVRLAQLDGRDYSFEEVMAVRSDMYSGRL